VMLLVVAGTCTSPRKMAKRKRQQGIASQVVVTMPSSCMYLRVAWNVAAKELVERCGGDLARTGIHRHLRRSYGDERDTVERTIRKGGTMQLMRLALGIEPYHRAEATLLVGFVSFHTCAGCFGCNDRAEPLA
jgi:hypothetical protein